MNDDWEPDPHPVAIQNIFFHPKGVEIHYIDEQDTAPDVMITKQVLLHFSALPKGEYEELVDTIRDWTDRGVARVREHRNE